LYSTAQYQQSRVLARGERIGRRDAWLSAEFERVVVIGGTFAVERSIRGFYWLGVHGRILSCVLDLCRRMDDYP